MPTFFQLMISLTAAILLGGTSLVFAQGELKYDPDKGFMIVDEKDKTGNTVKPLMRQDQAGQKGNTAVSPPQVTPSPRNANDIQVGRKKDPPTLYFMSGQEYYKNGDFSQALQNFKYADSVNPNPVYTLWVGKACRSLGQTEKMISVMNGIVKKYPECDVADDALLELAVYYQNADDYETATRFYSQIAEQYPFGISYTTGESLIEVVREQRKQLNAQLNTMLAIMGCTNEDVAVNLAAFQKSNGLKETGRADRATVRQIKKMHGRILDRDRLREKEAALAKKNMRFALIAGGIGIVNLLIALIILFQSRSRARQLDLLGETMSDLDAGRL
jgi:tetratricopeptide (TPR) repeat protein